jgi:hypothetical protein
MEIRQKDNYIIVCEYIRTNKKDNKIYNLYVFDKDTNKLEFEHKKQECKLLFNDYIDSMIYAIKVTKKIINN